MDFSFTDEQQELRRAIRDLVADRAGAEAVRKAMQTPTGHDPELWSIVASDLGLPGLAVADDRGGGGGSFVDVAVALGEAGPAPVPVPHLAGSVGATGS